MITLSPTPTGQVGRRPGRTSVVRRGALSVAAVAVLASCSAGDDPSPEVRPAGGSAIITGSVPAGEVPAGDLADRIVPWSPPSTTAPRSVPIS